ncbi:hypothetical protein [Enterobacter asburiae]|uniref:hypothetical protein n=1 Tax=Enterobacter asburiae TaxID=61645 RepID=UPI003F575B2B
MIWRGAFVIQIYAMFVTRFSRGKRSIFARLIVGVIVPVPLYRHACSVLTALRSASVMAINRCG